MTVLARESDSAEGEAAMVLGHACAGSPLTLMNK